MFFWPLLVGDRFLILNCVRTVRPIRTHSFIKTLLLVRCFGRCPASVGPCACSRLWILHIKSSFPIFYPLWWIILHSKAAFLAWKILVFEALKQLQGSVSGDNLELSAWPIMPGTSCEVHNSEKFPFCSRITALSSSWSTWMHTNWQVVSFFDFDLDL